MNRKAEAAEYAVLIAGPTASGKSVLALQMAKERGGVIINTDSMQVYSVLRHLTARPSDEEMALVPHRLYGHMHPSEHYSTGAWLADVRAVLADREIAGKPLFFVGGTGLYFRALLGGLSNMPDVPEAVRQRWNYRLVEDGSAKLHRILRANDPEAAMVIKPGDGQRIVRALAIREVSGRSILQWQADRGTPLVNPATAKRIIVEPQRSLLGEAIAERFDRMLSNGALDEVRALMALNLNPNLPAMKAIGVRELAAALAGQIAMEEAVTLAKTATRQYAKRQATWFRNQCGEEWKRVRANV